MAAAAWAPGTRPLPAGAVRAGTPVGHSILAAAPWSGQLGAEGAGRGARREGKVGGGPC